MSDKEKNNNFIQEDHNEGDVLTVKKVKTKRPSLFKVILLNDDYTPMDFVVDVLEKFFSKDHSEATDIMLNVHNKGKGVCGIFPYEIAETKVSVVNEYSRQHQYPLQCALEKI